MTMFQRCSPRTPKRLARRTAMSNYLPSVLLLVLVSLGTEARSQGTLVVNGGFDSGISGWGTSNISANGGWFPGKGNPGGAFLIGSTPSASTDPMIFQTITGLNPGTTYLVSGDYAFSDDFN